MLDMNSERQKDKDVVLREGQAEFRHITVNGQVSGIVDGMLVTSLEIVPSTPGWSQRLLDDVASLHLLKLQNLSLVFNHTAGGTRLSHKGQVASPILGFISASHCTLTHIRILVKGIDVGYTIPAAELLAVLSRTPQLTDLSIVEDAPTLLTDVFLAVFSY